MAGTNVVTLTEIGVDYKFPDGFFINTGKSSSYIDALKEINHLPFSKGDIYYSDDKWDFSQFTTRNISKDGMRFSFGPVMGTLKDNLKNYVLIKVLENKAKIQSINRFYSELKKFFIFVQQKHIYNAEDIPVSMVKDYLQFVRDSGSLTALRFAKSVLKDFYLQYSANFKDIASAGLLNLFVQDSYKEFKAYQEAHKSKEIPQEYFDRFIAACVHMLNDEGLDISYRGAAGVYIILSQTGLRIGEILGLTDHALKTIRIYDGQEANYLEYKTWKRENGNNTFSIERTFVNDLCKNAFEILLFIYKERRETLHMNYLYMGGSNMKTANFFPLNNKSFHAQSLRLLAKMDDLGLLETINLPDDLYPTLVYRTLNHSKLAIPSRFPKGTAIKTITYPSTQQFRFHVCTELYRKGVSLKYIQRFMGHLTFDMTKYHINTTSRPQEDMEYSLQILHDVVSGKTTILGDSKGLSERIQQFIAENNFHVEKDLDAICEKLALKIPIRQKTGGVCIKSSLLRECSTDALTNEFYCAYGVCPNIVHFYYMVDISYRQCKELEKIIGINRIRETAFYNERRKKITTSEKALYPKQIQKNINMLCTITTKRLIPELEELKKMVSKYGVAHIYMEHPELKDIIENLDTIEEEVEKWKSLR